MRATAVILAVLGDVLGLVAAIGVVFLTDVLDQWSPFGEAALVRDRALWSVGAAILGVVATPFVLQRPQLAAAGLGVAGILGAYGTLAFIPATVVYAVAAIVSLRLPTPVSAAPLAVRSGPEPTLPLVPATRARSPRTAIVVGTAVVALVILALVGSAVGKDEKETAKALFAALQQRDDVAVAKLLAAEARTGDLARDAASVRQTVFAGSALEKVMDEWVDRFGSALGVKATFRDLTYATKEKNGDRAYVEVTGVFEPTHENILANAVLSAFRGPFRVNVPLVRSGSEWLIAGRVAAPSSASVAATARPAAPTAGTSTAAPAALTAAPTAVAATGAPASARASATAAATTRPSAPGSATPTPAPVPTLAATFRADFADPRAAGLPRPEDAKRYSMRYSGETLTLSGCVDRYTVTFYRDRVGCYWLIQPAQRWAAVEVAAQIQGRGEWGILVGASGAAATGTSAPRSALLAVMGDGDCHIRHLADGRWSTLVRGDCRPSGLVDTMRFELVGPEAIMTVNGREVARAIDPRTDAGSAFGIHFNAPESLSGSATVLVRSFAAR